MPSNVVAGPKEDCALVVRSLGYDTSDYAFKDAGIFSKAQHIFGSLTCYVSADGKFDSLYRVDIPIAEDGYFGIDSLRARDTALQQAKNNEDAAGKRWRDELSKIKIDLELQLTKVRRESNPFSKRAMEANAPKADKAATALLSEPKDIVVTTLEDPEPKIDDIGASQSTYPIPSARADQTLPISPSAAGAPKESAAKWTTSERLNIRSCPSTSCGVTGWMTEGAIVTVYEEHGGWSRIAERSPAMCEGGVSDAIDSGNRECTTENGIVDGYLTRWVSSQHLTDSMPKSVQDSFGCKDGFLKDSDNYNLYSNQFCTATLKLIKSGTCTKRDFEELPWGASTTKGERFYFAYCGGMKIENKWYLDVRSGKLFQ